MAESMTLEQYQKDYPGNNFFVLGPTNPLRKIAFGISNSKAFDSFILLAIVVNCIMMAMSAPLPLSDTNQLNDKIEALEVYLLAIFIFEAAIKMLTQGFIMHAGSYIRNGWNLLDFTVVITGIMGLPSVGMAGNAGPMKVVKAARVLRPLKLVSGVPSLQIVMSAILKSMASLLQISLLIGFVIVIFAIVSLTFLVGKFHFTCFKNVTEPLKMEYIVEAGRLCSVSGSGRQCPEGSICKEYWDGPNFGVTQFDNIITACLTIFTCITCEGWTDTMYWSQDVMDAKGQFVFIIYYALNVIGAQFMLNLVCGVLSGEFSKEKERVESRNKFIKERREEEEREKRIASGEAWIDEGERLRLEEEAKKLEQSQDEPIEGVDPPPQLNALQSFVVKNNAFRANLKAFMLSKFMFWFIVSAVFFNSVFGAIQHYNQPQWITDITSITDILFLGIFVSEMCLKLYAVGPSEYFKSKFNKFDFSVVVMGLINLFMDKMFGINLGIPVLRQLRLMRLFKFTKYYKKMKNLVQSIINSMASIMSLLVLLFLFLMIFALLGMNIFGGQFYTRPEIGKPFSRTNFDDFFNAMLAVFQIITGEDWNFVMYEGIVAYGGPRTGVGLAVSLYFVGVTVLGNYVLLNVFLAIAVDNITLDDDDEAAEEEAAQAEQEHKEAIKEKYAPPPSARSGSAELDVSEEDAFAKEDRMPPRGGEHQIGESILETMKDPSRATGTLPTFTNAEPVPFNTLFILPTDGFIRKKIHPLVTSPHFDNFILALILISSGLLAFENVTHPEANINKILGYADYFFSTVFALEVLLKILNFGFALHPGSYCRDSWNCADMFVVTCAITSLILSQNKNASSTVKSIVKILRILRVLRPLKSINKLPELKIVFQCMIFSLQNVFNVLIITVQFLLIFSMMGVQLFSGKLFQCNDLSKEFEEECQGNFITFDGANYNRPQQTKREWTLIDWNFNHLGIAMVTLFSSATGEGWPAVMQTGIDSQEMNQGPLLNNKIWISIYFIVFVVIFSFFFINVFVGLIILTFQMEQQDKSAAIDRNTKNSFDFVICSKPLERFMPEDVKSWQYKAWALLETTQWEILISAFIALNTIVLMMEFADQPKWYADILELIGDVFTFIFTVEFALKMFALGCNYFKDFWNNFDMFIVIGSILDFMIKKILPPGTVPFDPSIFKLFRALRLIKLLRRFRDLRILLWTFLQSFKALPYVCMLIFLLFFVYGIIGMQIFSKISIENEEEPWAQINRNNHFRTYFTSTQVLFRVATGENWPNIMLACTSGAKCDMEMPAVIVDNLVDCGTPIAYVYFVSFVFFCSFLMLNLFIAVIMDNFAFLTEDSSILGPHHLDEFVNVWSDFDPRASGRIKHTEVCELLRQMLPPVGLGIKCPKTVAYKRMVQMNMRYYRDCTVDYTGTFFALVRTGLQINTDDANLKKTDTEFKNMLKKQFGKALPKRTLDMVIPRVPKHAKHMTIAKMYTAKLVWENYKTMKKAAQQGRRKSVFQPKQGSTPVPNGKTPVKQNGQANGHRPPPAAAAPKNRNAPNGVALNPSDEEWC